MLINRLDSICTTVLTGRWPVGRRHIADMQPSYAAEEQAAGEELGFTRLVRKGGASSGESGEVQDTEFTVKLLKVSARVGQGEGGRGRAMKSASLIWNPTLTSQEEGLKLTFSKQALLPNGAGGEGSTRRRHRDTEVRSRRPTHRVCG